jgi:tRNA pseudouridine-54 N-methylase
VVFHAILGGPPRPVVHLKIDGAKLRDARVDEKTWEGILRRVLEDGKHPGIQVDRTSLQALVKKKHADGYKIFVLEEKGTNVFECDMSGDVVFVLGDQIGLPKKDEKYLLRFGKKMSLGKQAYLAASCIDIVNFVIDQSATG